MATDWDPSREYDSQTFSDDYNLHGASGRSFDHPSVTRDDNFFGDLSLSGDNSIENADLIADIVDGRIQDPLQQQRSRRLRQLPLHQADENSQTSIIQYLLNGGEDPGEYQGNGFDPRDQDQYADMEYIEDDQGDQGRDWSGSTPKRNVRNTVDSRTTPKASPVARRTMLPVRSNGLAPRPQVATRTTSFDDAPKQSPQHQQLFQRQQWTPRSTNQTRGSLPTTPQMDESIPQQKEQLQQLPPLPPPLQPQLPTPKPVYRSAMKPINATNTKSKLGRHIQLPTEILDDEDEKSFMEEEISHPSQSIQQSQEVQDHLVEYERPSHEREPPVTPVVPGPSRFSRISKKNVSPAKKVLTTIPTPQDDGNEKAKQAMKEMKAVLGRIGFLPLTGNLDSSLEGLDDAGLEKGGLCEMMGLLQKLGTMYEKQKEVIHQMTDQLIGGEGTSNPQSEEKLQEMAQELGSVKRELDASREMNMAMEKEMEKMSKEMDRLHAENTAAKNLASENPTRQDWSSIEEAIQQRGQQQESTKGSAARRKIGGQNSGSTSTNWKAHVQKIEQELEALKVTLTNSNSLDGREEEDGEMAADRMNEVLLENKRLQSKNKTLGKELLQLQSNTAASEQRSKYDRLQSLFKKVMSRLGVDHHQDILPALDEIERIVEDLPNLRRFIAKSERIVWEAEINAGLVRVQRHAARAGDVTTTSSPPSAAPGPLSSSTPPSSSSRIKTTTETEEADADRLVIQVGRTCSQSFEKTLQRLREWSELLDVLNHVEFANDDDNQDGHHEHEATVGAEDEQQPASDC